MDSAEIVSRLTPCWSEPSHRVLIAIRAIRGRIAELGPLGVAKVAIVQLGNTSSLLIRGQHQC